MKKKRLKEEWKQVIVDYLNKLISIVPKCLHHVIKHMDYPT